MPAAQPRITLRFAFYSALALLLVGIATFWVVRHETQRRAEADVAARAGRVALRAGLWLTPADFEAPVSGTRRRELDRLFSTDVRDNLVRVKIWNPSGVVVYSSDPSLIGRRDAELRELRTALAGEVAQEIAPINAEGGTGPDFETIETFVPIRPANGPPVAALEVFEDYRPIEDQMHSVLTPIAIALGVALLLLYASLFPILRQVTGALEARTRRLQQQSDELEKSIVERKQAFAGLREADARYRALVEELPLVSYVSSLDTPGLSTYVSPQLEDMLGYTPEEWLATPGLFWEVIHPDDAERVRNEHHIGYTKAESFSTQYRLRAKSGHVIWVEDQVRVIHGEGQPALAQGFLIDITARKNSELALLESEARFRGLVGNIPGAVFRCDIDSDWTMEYLSDAIEELVGYPSSDFIGNQVRTFASVVHPDDRERLEADVAASVGDGRPYTTDYRMIHRDGSVRYVLERGQAVTEADGHVRLDGAIFDVTERMEVENERLKLAAIVESSDDAITSADLDGIVTSWNKGAERMFGYTAEEMVGRSGEILVPDGDTMMPSTRIASVVELGEGRFEVTRKRKDGTFIDIAVTMSAVRNNAGDVVGVAAISQDITDRKRVEQEREEFTRELEVRNERLLELDRLKDEFVALVSHELRTPLTSIRGYLELVIDGEAGAVTEEQRKFLGIVQRNANRLLALVGDLLFLAQIEAGKLSLEFGAVDLSAVAAESVETARPLAEDKNITLTLATSPLQLLAGDRTRLAQLLDNLISNAIKFTPEGGRVDVRASSARGNAILEVRDTGMGIPAEEQEHVFERFFRTSRATEQAIQGTGLGLAISKAIVHAHGGRITLASSDGEGATFRVTIPIRAVQPAQPTREEIAS